TDKDGKLSRKELEAAAAVLLKHDADDDEMIAPTELRGEMPGNLGYELIFTGGDPTSPITDGPLMQVNHRDGSFGRGLAKTELAGVKKGPNGALQLQAGNVLLNLGINGPQGQTMVRPPPVNEEQVIKQQFAAADTDGNGYLDETEARRSPFGPSFKLMDADGD